MVFELLNFYLLPHASVYSHLFISVFAPPPPFLTQIETIGDAYCVAVGLHKKVDSHAKPIAHMALKMMELSEEVLTPDGKPIKVSFHSSAHDTSNWHEDVWVGSLHDH